MIEGRGAVFQAFLGTLMTWGLTAAGAAMVIFLRGNQKKYLDASLGFAAGVMMAASFWSLLAPAIELAESSGSYGSEGQFAFVPIAAGFILGALFVFGTDKLISCFNIDSTSIMITLNRSKESEMTVTTVANDLECGQVTTSNHKHEDDPHVGMESFSDCLGAQHNDGSVSRKRRNNSHVSKKSTTSLSNQEELEKQQAAVAQWKRIMLLVIAITVHNIPEGLAVGVSFGAIGTTESATFEAARNLAIGIGIQNFPEGLAVSLPLHAAGFSIVRSFFYGQLSGMVEPIFGILGALAVTIAATVLPYALSFAAGAMIYITCSDILPEAHSSGNDTIASWGTMLGFVVMMCLDVGLG